MNTRTIKVDYIARVEGEGAMHIRIADDRLEDLKLNIFEPPRFFEALLRGRQFTEAPDITARICGICPVAYLMGAVHAMEMICQTKIPPPIRNLRRLLYCGEWIESHILHMAMLHAPDFLGYPDAISMAKDHPDIVKKALRIKKIGNDIMALLGGREIHPINVRVGGFYKVPTKHELRRLFDDLNWGLDAAKSMVRFAASLDIPDFEQDYEFVCLKHPDEYPLNEGRLVSNRGMDFPISEYDKVLIEEHVQHSTALHSRMARGGVCQVGPLARYSLNFDKLTPQAKVAATEAGLNDSCFNPFRSICVRGVEVVFAFEEALRLVQEYEEPDRPFEEANPRAGTGYGCTEAPRGICYHRYTIDESGAIRDAKIVSPTAVNQRRIEQDLWHFVEPRTNWSDDRLRDECERLIRNYDPCISCAAHFLKLKVDRT